MRLTQMIEALLFASDAPLSAADLLRIDEQLDEDTVEAIIQELRAEYELGERSFQVYEVAGGYQLLTRPEFVSVLERYDSVPQPARLSAAALEVLAIIAYRQPLGRAEIEDIRGVGSSGVLRTLQERELIDAVARGEGLGRPLLYGTTQKFLEHFGFRSLEDLPRPDELPVVLRDRTIPLTSAVATPGTEAGEEAATAGEAAPGEPEVAAAAETDAATPVEPEAAAAAEAVSTGRGEPEATAAVEPASVEPPEQEAAAASVATAAEEQAAAASGPKLVVDAELEPLTSEPERAPATSDVEPARTEESRGKPVPSASRPTAPVPLPRPAGEREPAAAERDIVPAAGRTLPLAASPAGRANAEPDGEGDSDDVAEPEDARSDRTGGDEPEFSEVGGHAPGG